MGGKSGGSSAPTEQTVYSESLPPYVEPYFKRMLQRAEGESLQPYTPYGGQRLAYFSPDERKSQAMTRGYAQAGTPQEFGQARDVLTGLSSPIQSQYQAGQTPDTYQAGQTGGTQFDSSAYAGGYDPSMRQSGYTASGVAPSYQPIGFEQNIQRFMSPYQQNVTDIQKREAIRQSEMMGEQIGSRAAQAGGLGGYREAILQAERQRNLGQQLGDIQARGSQSAYDAATRQIGAERAADLASAQYGLGAFGETQRAGQMEEQLGQRAFEFGEQARQQAARLGLTAQQAQDASQQAQEKFILTAMQQDEQARQAQSQQALAAYQQQEQARQAQERMGQSAYELSQRYGQSAAQQLGSLGEARQRDVQQRIAAMQGIGSQARALRQASLDTGYEDFLRQQAYPQQQLGFYSNILRGVPVQPQRTVSSYQQQPGLFQQALGLGLGGLGMYRGMGGG